MSRRVGMSRHQKPAQLLSIVGNKPRPGKVAKAVDDPPLSSDEEEGDETTRDDDQNIPNVDNEASPLRKLIVPAIFEEEVGDDALTDDHQEIPLQLKIPKAFGNSPTTGREKDGELAVPPFRRELKVPKALDDPPLSRNEEAGCKAMTDNQRVPSATNRQIPTHSDPESDPHLDALHDSSDSSSDQRLALANIKRTDFGKANETSKPMRGTRRKGGDVESPKPKTGPPRNAQTTSSKRRRLNEKTPAASGQGKAATDPPSSGVHQTDEHGFTKRKVSKTTYQKKDTNSRGHIKKKADTASSSLLKVPDTFGSPEKSGPAKLLIPNNVIPSSPPESPPGKLLLKHSRDGASPLEKKGVLGTKGFKPQGPAIRPPRRNLGKEKPVARPRAPSPPPAIFKLPAQISELALRAGDDSQEPGDKPSGILSDVESDGHSSDVEAIGEPAGATTVCPWCGEPVDKALLDESSKGKRMNVRQQTRFCYKHRKHTAVETWQSNGYPDVDWQDMDRRFAEHHTLLLDVVNGKSSHFRSIMEEKIQSGKARSMKKEDNLNPGYYGPRGFNLMCDYLVNEFGDLLKEKAVDDRVIAGRGSAAFIQSVLVAELAVQLIKDDMHVSVDEARTILDESKALGEMVHEEV